MWREYSFNFSHIYGGCSWPLKQQCGLYFSTLTPQTFPQSPIIVQQYSDSFLRENDEKTKEKLE